MTAFTKYVQKNWYFLCGLEFNPGRYYLSGLNTYKNDDLKNMNRYLNEKGFKCFLISNQNRKKKLEDIKYVTISGKVHKSKRNETYSV